MLASVFMLILLLTWKQYRMPSPIIICGETFCHGYPKYNASHQWMLEPPNIEGLYLCIHWAVCLFIFGIISREQILWSQEHLCGGLGKSVGCHSGWILANSHKEEKSDFGQIHLFFLHVNFQSIKIHKSILQNNVEVLEVGNKFHYQFFWVYVVSYSVLQRALSHCKQTEIYAKVCWSAQLKNCSAASVVLSTRGNYMTTPFNRADCHGTQQFVTHKQHLTLIIVCF